MRGAIAAGYSRAFGTIFDSHVTTLISSLILWWLGTGSIRGFGVALTFGLGKDAVSTDRQVLNRADRGVRAVPVLPRRAAARPSNPALGIKRASNHLVHCCRLVLLQNKLLKLLLLFREKNEVF